MRAGAAGCAVQGGRLGEGGRRPPKPCPSRSQPRGNRAARARREFHAHILIPHDTVRLLLSVIVAARGRARGAAPAAGRGRGGEHAGSCFISSIRRPLGHSRD